MTDEIEKKEDEVTLSESEVWDVIKFARELEKGMYGNIFTPDLLNRNLRNISYDPMAATEATLASALQNPKESEDFLRKFSESFELTSMPYKRLISYLGDMLAFDYVIVSDAEEDDYKTPAYKKEQEKVYEFFDRFNVKQEFGTAVRQMLRNEAFFFCTRMDGNKYVLQELDNYYCKITSRFDYGMLFDFNFLLFMQPGIDINLYPVFFKERFGEIFKGNNKYIPSLPVDMRGQSSFVYWNSVPPQVGQVFKLSPEMGARIPYFTALFSDLLLQPLMRNLQKNKSIAACTKILSSEVALLNKEQKTTLKDAISISPETLSRFLTLVKTAIGESIKLSVSPLTNTQGISFEPGEDVYNQYLLNSVASSGVNSNLIFTSGARPNQLESSLSLRTDEILMENVYPVFNSFLEYQLSLITKKFHWKAILEGTNFFTNRESRLEPLKTLMTSGIVLPQKIAAALGIEPHIFERMLREGRANDFVGKLTPIIPATNLAAGEQKAGAPKKSDSKITDSGAQTRADASNLSPTKGGKS